MQRDSVSLEELSTTIVDKGLIAWVTAQSKRQQYTRQHQYSNNKHSTEHQGTVGQLSQQLQFSTRSAQSTGSNRSNIQQHKGALEVITLAIVHFTLQRER